MDGNAANFTMADLFVSDLMDEGMTAGEISAENTAAPSEDSKVIPKVEPMDTEDEEDEREFKTPKLPKTEMVQDLDSLLKIRNGKELPALISKIAAFNDAQLSDLEHNRHAESSKRASQGYDLVIEATGMATAISEEISRLVKYIRDIYEKKFAELEELVPDPLDYVKTVKTIGNRTDLADVMPELLEILPRGAPIMVSIALSTNAASADSSLDPDRFTDLMRACDEVLYLNEAKSQLIQFVEGRMPLIAPNLAAIVGSGIAAKLMGAAGGLKALARMHSGNVQLLGIQQMALGGFSSRAVQTHTGFINECDLVRDAPKGLKKVIRRLVANKCTLAVRADAGMHGEDDSGKTGGGESKQRGEVGRRLRQKIEERMAQLQAPAAPKAVKPRATPDSKPKKQRGGTKARKRREATRMTEVGKQKNQMPFGMEAQNEDAYTGKSFGRIGKSDSGRVRLTASSKMDLGKKRKRLEAEAGIMTPGARHRGSIGGDTTIAGTGGGGEHGSATSLKITKEAGRMTSLSFTPAQPMMLGTGGGMADSLVVKMKDMQSQKYFGGTSSFVKVENKNKRQKTGGETKKEPL